MYIEVDVDQLAEKVADRLMVVLGTAIQRKIYPVEIKGDFEAGNLIGISGDAMKQRRYNGFYIEGKHFYKKSDKIVMWFRDALLEEEALNGRSKTILAS